MPVRWSWPNRRSEGGARRPPRWGELLCAMTLKRVRVRVAEVLVCAGARLLGFKSGHRHYARLSGSRVVVGVRKPFRRLIFTTFSTHPPPAVGTQHLPPPRTLSHTHKCLCLRHFREPRTPDLNTQLIETKPTARRSVSDGNCLHCFALTLARLCVCVRASFKRICAFVLSTDSRS